MRMRILAITIIVLLAASCSSMVVDTNWDKTADFKAYKTWSWFPAGPSPTGNPDLDDPELIARIKKIVGAGFKKDGFTMVTDSPDFFVNYHVALSDELNPTRIENFYEFANYSVFMPRWESTYATVWTTGTLVIDVIDTETKTLVWRGFAQADINPQAGPKENNEKVRKFVEKMLKKFPPK